jgi:5-methyltetrahydrofolate--homocysteine methyltransferase
VNSLLNDQLKSEFDTKTRAEYARLREEHSAKTREKKLLTLAQARANRTSIEWDNYRPPKPEFLGVRVVTSGARLNGSDSTPVSGAGDGVPPSRTFPASSKQALKQRLSLNTLSSYIDWSPFFHVWELRGRYPAIFDDPVIGKQARELFDDAQNLLNEIIGKNLLTARGVFGFWPANCVGDDVHLYTDETRAEKLATFYFLRQQIQKPAGQANHCLADFVAPGVGGHRSPLQDYLGGFAVSIHGTDELAEQFKKEHDDYSAILGKALADRFAEAFAEYLHQQARIAWRFGRDEKLSRAELIREKYRGIRPAAGYPACPDHIEKRTLFDLLKAEKNAGIRLTESFAMHPGASVSGLYFSHPDAKYFAVGQIGRDQVVDYAARRSEAIAVVEKRLAPNLGYES